MFHGDADMFRLSLELMRTAIYLLILYFAIRTTHELSKPSEKYCLQQSQVYSHLNTSSEVSEFQVPNIVHYTWYALDGVEAHFKHFLGVLSARNVLNPEVIYIHTNVSQLKGTYWHKIMAINRVKVLHDGSPRELLGQKLKDPYFFSSDSNIGRLKYMLQYGGIYLDFDVIVIRNLDRYRVYECTLGKEEDNLLNTGLIICSKSSPFLYLWANSYFDDYQPDVWIYNTGLKTTELAKRFPHLIHIEPDKFHRPNWREVNKIWGNETFAWEAQYAVHTWYRFKHRSPFYKEKYKLLHPSGSLVMRMNNTYGKMARYILSIGRE